MFSQSPNSDTNGSNASRKTVNSQPMQMRGKRLPDIDQNLIVTHIEEFKAFNLDYDQITALLIYEFATQDLPIRNNEIRKTLKQFNIICSEGNLAKLLNEEMVSYHYIDKVTKGYIINVYFPNDDMDWYEGDDIKAAFQLLNKLISEQLVLNPVASEESISGIEEAQVFDDNSSGQYIELLSIPNEMIEMWFLGDNTSLESQNNNESIEGGSNVVSTTFYSSTLEGEKPYTENKNDHPLTYYSESFIDFSNYTHENSCIANNLVLEPQPQVHKPHTTVTTSTHKRDRVIIEIDSDVSEPEESRVAKLQKISSTQAKNVDEPISNEFKHTEIEVSSPFDLNKWIEGLDQSPERAHLAKQLILLLPPVKSYIYNALCIGKTEKLHKLSQLLTQLGIQPERDLGVKTYSSIGKTWFVNFTDKAGLKNYATFYYNLALYFQRTFDIDLKDKLEHSMSYMQQAFKIFNYIVTFNNETVKFAVVKHVSYTLSCTNLNRFELLIGNKKYAPAYEKLNKLFTESYSTQKILWHHSCIPPTSDDTIRGCVSSTLNIMNSDKCKFIYPKCMSFSTKAKSLLQNAQTGKINFSLITDYFEFVCILSALQISPLFVGLSPEIELNEKNASTAIDVIDYERFNQLINALIELPKLIINKVHNPLLYHGTSNLFKPNDSMSQADSARDAIDKTSRLQ